MIKEATTNEDVIRAFEKLSDFRREVYIIIDGSADHNIRAAGNNVWELEALCDQYNEEWRADLINDGAYDEDEDCEDYYSVIEFCLSKQEMEDYAYRIAHNLDMVWRKKTGDAFHFWDGFYQIADDWYGDELNHNEDGDVIEDEKYEALFEQYVLADLEINYDFIPNDYAEWCL